MLLVGVALTSIFFIYKEIIQNKKQEETFEQLTEIAEGQVWEAAMTAGHFGLSRLIAIIDSNGLQSDGFVKDILNIKGMFDQWTTLGFRVFHINGHDFHEIHEAFSSMDFEDGHPKLVIAETTKGKGISFMENNNVWHHEPISDELYAKAKAELS